MNQKMLFDIRGGRWQAAVRPTASILQKIVFQIAYFSNERCFNRSVARSIYPDIDLSFADGIEALHKSGEQDPVQRCSKTEMISSEVPRTPIAKLSDKYRTLTRVLRRHLSISCNDIWEAILRFTEFQCAKTDGVEHPIETILKQIAGTHLIHSALLALKADDERRLRNTDRKYLKVFCYL